jgi:hypothetical protein
MSKQKATRKQIVEYTEKYIEHIEKVYGISNHQVTTPYLHMSGEKRDDIKGEFCYLFNEITVYWKNITGLEELIRTLIHEYKHYLQSPTWMTRYYKMGYTYDNHPYEEAARKEEENWYSIWEQAL